MTLLELLTNEIRKFADANILVVGDAMLDRYWYGDVERISPEAPVPVVAVGRNEARLGGGANVAQNITALGGKCVLLSVIGDDEAGRLLQQKLFERGIDNGLVTEAAGATTTKHRIIARNQQLIRLDFDHRPEDESVRLLHTEFAQRLGAADAVIFSDYGKGALRALETMLDLAVARGVPALVDPKSDDFERYRGATVVTPNRAEFARVVGTWGSEEELLEKADFCQTRYGIGSILLTRSEQGMSLFRRGKPGLRQQAKAREVFDVSGAGDTVIGVYALALAVGADEEAALHLANLAGGIVVGKLGTATASVPELIAELKREQEQ